MTCATCRWFDADYFLCADDEDHPMDRCGWPAERLPYSLRYGSRERMSVVPTDGAGCAGHEPGTPVWGSFCPLPRVEPAIVRVDGR